MKTNILLIASLLFTYNSFGQTKENDNNTTLKIKSEIQSSKSEMKVTKIEVWDYSAEGGEASGYFDADMLRLIEVTFLGETFKLHVNYFINDDKLILAEEERHTYNRPIDYDAEKAKEMGDDEFHDPTKTVISKNQYFFDSNENLFLWLDGNGLEVDLNDGANVEVGLDLYGNYTNMALSIRNADK